MKRLVFIYFSVVFALLLLVLTGCDKKAIDYSKLEGTTWIAEADNILFTLCFSDKSECSIINVQNDEPYSANQTIYYWRYLLDFDSVLALGEATFRINPIGEENRYFFFQWGYVENKKLYLSYTTNDDFNNLEEEDIKVMCFTRDK